MLYSFIKFTVNLALQVFFKRLTVKHLERIPTKGPLIVVANHPNSMMDAVAIACNMRQQIYFLTKGTFFNTPFKKWFLRQFNMVPIYRKEDLRAGEQADNEAVFEQCYQFLKSGGTLMIFPEGTSIKERRLRPIKTGAARIALGVEQANNFTLGLQIISIGLNYSEANRFRSELLIDIDEPIHAKDWQEAYMANDRDAVNALTAEIEKRLQTHMIVTQHEEEDRLAAAIASIYSEVAAANEEWSKGEEHYQIAKHAVQALHYFQRTKPEMVQDIAARINHYHHQLHRLKLKNNALGKASDKGLFYDAVNEFLVLLFGLPFYLFGLLHHYIPYLIPAKVAKAITKEVEYHAPIMMVVGMLSFSLAYIFYFFASFVMGFPWWASAIYIAILPTSGYFCLYYWGKWLRARQQLWLLSLFYRRSNLVAQLLQQRKQLITDLNQAKDEYLQSLDN